MILIIACGNTLREDDGAGPVLGERLAAALRAHRAAVRCITVQQLTPELSLAVAESDVARVVFVDAREAGGTGETVRLTPVLPAATGAGLGHHQGPEMLLYYAQTLFGKSAAGLPGFARQVTVPGYQFGHGETISSRTQAAILEAIPTLHRICFSQDVLA